MELRRRTGAEAPALNVSGCVCGGLCSSDADGTLAASLSTGFRVPSLPRHRLGQALSRAQGAAAGAAGWLTPGPRLVEPMPPTAGRSGRATGGLTRTCVPKHRLQGGRERERERERERRRTAGPKTRNTVSNRRPHVTGSAPTAAPSCCGRHCPLPVSQMPLARVPSPEHGLGSRPSQRVPNRCSCRSPVNARCLSLRKAGCVQVTEAVACLCNEGLSI